MELRVLCLVSMLHPQPLASSFFSIVRCCIFEEKVWDDNTYFFTLFSIEHLTLTELLIAVKVFLKR